MSVEDAGVVFTAQINVIDAITRSPVKTHDPMVLEWQKDVKITEVPLIQIWGTTLDGVRECIVVHGMFPKIYVNCPQKDDEHEEYFEDLFMNLLHN